MEAVNRIRTDNTMFKRKRTNNYQQFLFLMIIIEGKTETSLGIVSSMECKYGI